MYSCDFLEIKCSLKNILGVEVKIEISQKFDTKTTCV